MIDRRRLLASSFAFGLATTASGAAFAQSGTITRLIVPLTPGSPIDVLARLYAPHMSIALGHTVIVENRPGAGTTIAAKMVATSAPDGHTLLLASTSHPISAAMYRNLSFDPFKDFIAVAPTATTPWLIIVEPSVPAKSVRELVGYAKANPGAVHFGYGQGTAPHIIGDAIKKMNGVDIASIPYKGGAQVIPDMLGGRIQMNIGTPSTLLPLVREGKVKPVGVTSTRRIPELPDVPTLAESGITGLPELNWAGIIAPAGTPAPVIGKLNAVVNEISKAPEVTASLAKLGFQAQFGSPAEFAAFFASEKVKWDAAVKLAGVQVQ